MQETRYYAPPGFASLTAAHTEPSGPPDPPNAPEPARRQPTLSPTELKVFDLLLKRLTEKETAEALGRSPNTVHVHVRNIYRKLGVQSREELFAVPRNLITAKGTKR